MLRIKEDALTFDDVLLVPGYSEVLPKEVSLRSRISRNIMVNIPIVSAAMDTVTEHRLAIAIAQEGGLGIIHKNMTISQQAYEVRQVKKFEAGVVRKPITIQATASVRDLLAVTGENNISGVPVMLGDDLVGIVTSRDVRFEKDLNQSVSGIMTPKDKLVTVKEGTGKDKIQELLHIHRIEKILMVDDNFKLKGLVTVKDIAKAKTHLVGRNIDQHQFINWLLAARRASEFAAIEQRRCEL